jgi:hypothetical protein
MNGIIKEIEHIFCNVYGGLYLEINKTKHLDYLKERKWDAISFDEMQYECILDQLNNVNLSTLIHVALINQDSKFLNNLLTEFYKIYVENPTQRIWLKQIIFVIVNKDHVNDEIKEKFNKFFFKEYKEIDGFLIFKHRILDYEN